MLWRASMAEPGVDDHKQSFPKAEQSGRLNTFNNIKNGISQYCVS